MNIRNTKLVALSPTLDAQSKKRNSNDLKEKELNLIYRQSFSSQVKPSTSQQNYSAGYQQNQQMQGILTQSNQQKLLLQQPQSAQTIRNYSVKGGNTQIVTQNQIKQLGQENLFGAISINNNVMTNSQQIQHSQKNGKIHKSQSLQKGIRANFQVGSFKNLKNFQFMGNNNFNSGKVNNENNENIENENISDKQIQHQMSMGNSSTNILNIQFNPSPNLNRLSDIDIDMKKSLANIRLPKLPVGPLTEKSKEKNSKNQQKLNNFVDNRNIGLDNRNSENLQGEDKEKQKKNDKDVELERIKDRFKNYKNSKEIVNLLDQKPGTPPHENQESINTGHNTSSGNQQLGNRVSDILKKDEELQKVYGGVNIKGLRSNTPKQNNGIIGLKPSYSTTSFQATPQTGTLSVSQSFGMNVFSTKIVPKKNSIQSLQQKQLRLLDKQAQQNRENQNNSHNSSQVKEENEDKQQNKKGPLYISHYSYKSKAGCNYQGPKKNQDNFIIHPNLNKMQNRYLFAVCDGHGVNGHDVSAFIRNQFPKILETLLAKDLMCLEEEYISSCLKLAFLQLSQKLLESRIDCTFSGSTFVVVLIIDDKIWCANTGDSRGILCKQTKALWNVEELSNDHKADDPEERKRIEESGGRVDSYRDYNGDPVGPARVWMKYDDIPGLAMSRSFGDLIAAQCGVICEPDIKYFNIEDDDRFIVIASDGVWEFLNNRQVMVHVMPYYIRQQPEMACQKLVKEATNNWKQHDEVVDDITAICVFLHKNKPKLQQSNKEMEIDQTENPFAQIQQEENDDIKKEDTEKLIEERRKTTENIEEDLIEGVEDKSVGSRFIKNVNQQQDNITPTSNQVTINMKQRKELSILNQYNSVNGKNRNAQKTPSLLMQKYEQEEKEIEDVIEKELNKINQQVSCGPKIQNSTTTSSVLQIKQDVNKSKTKLPTNHKENVKKTEESSKNLIPDIDDSDDDSEYSKDFELDRLRAQKNQKLTQDNNDNQKKNSFKDSNIQKYNFDEDDEDDDAFFKHL